MDDAASPGPGDAVTVAIRPEVASVDALGENPEPEPAPGRTQVTGKVAQGTYLGDTSEYRIQTDAVGELVVRRQNVREQAAARAFAPGEAVLLTWHEEANLILTS
jgi:ABC-type Fe3+/spermidine/putrescine transport system ATPase subunit